MTMTCKLSSADTEGFAASMAWWPAEASVPEHEPGLFMKASRKHVDRGRFPADYEDVRGIDRDGVSGRGIGTRPGRPGRVHECPGPAYVPVSAKSGGHWTAPTPTPRFAPSWGPPAGFSRLFPMALRLQPAEAGGPAWALSHAHRQVRAMRLQRPADAEDRTRCGPWSRGRNRPSSATRGCEHAPGTAGSWPGGWPCRTTSNGRMNRTAGSGRIIA
jgi:hypothetical protein